MKCPLMCDNGYKKTGDFECLKGEWTTPACVPEVFLGTNDPLEADFKIRNQTWAGSAEILRNVTPAALFQNRQGVEDLPRWWLQRSAVRVPVAFRTVGASRQKVLALPGVLIGPTGGRVAFFYKVSSEAGRDQLRFLCDGAELTLHDFPVSGSRDAYWSHASFQLLAGLHTLKWVYEKDSSADVGRDEARVGGISLFNGAIVGVVHVPVSTLDVRTGTWRDTFGTDAAGVWNPILEAGNSDDTFGGQLAGEMESVDDVVTYDGLTIGDQGGALSFLYQTTGPEGWDMLDLRINSATVVGQSFPASGDFGWRSATFALLPGTLALRWAFRASVPGSLARLNRLEVRSAVHDPVRLGISLRITHIEGERDQLVDAMSNSVAALFGVSVVHTYVSLHQQTSYEKGSLSRRLEALSLYNLYELKVGVDCETSASCASLSFLLSEIYEDPELLMIPIRGGLRQGMIKVAHKLQPAVQAGNPTPGLMSGAAMSQTGFHGGAGGSLTSDSWGADTVALLTALLGGTAVVLTIAAAAVFLMRRGLLPFGPGRDYAYSRDFPKPNAYDDD
jgi:hypothetical protein